MQKTWETSKRLSSWARREKNTIENDHATPCTFYSTEMTNSQLMARMMANKEHEKSKLWEFIFLFCINVG